MHGGRIWSRSEHDGGVADTQTVQMNPPSCFFGRDWMRHTAAAYAGGGAAVLGEWTCSGPAPRFWEAA